MLNTKSATQTDQIYNNANFPVEEQTQNTFAYYDHIDGTKYKKNKCALLMAATGAIGGFTVAALVDQPTRNDILKGVGAGMASSILLLLTSVSSLKPLTERGILSMQAHIKQRLKSCLIVNKNINNDIAYMQKKLTQLQPQSEEEHNDLNYKAALIYEKEQEAYKKGFQEVTMLIGSYLAVRGIYYCYNGSNFNTNTPPADTHNNCHTNRQTANNDEDKYTQAAASLYHFINQESNDWWSQQILIDSLKGCLTKYDIIVVKSFFLRCPERRPVLYKVKGPKEVQYNNLKFNQQSLINESLNLKDQIKTIQKKHGIEVTDDGKIIFPNLQEFATSLPK